MGAPLLLLRWIVDSFIPSTALNITQQTAVTMADHVAYHGTHNQTLDALLSGRDIRWYRGHLAKLTAIIVSIQSLRVKNNSLTHCYSYFSGFGFGHLHDQRIRWVYDERSSDRRKLARILQSP